MVVGVRTILFSRTHPLLVNVLSPPPFAFWLLAVKIVGLTFLWMSNVECRVEEQCMMICVEPLDIWAVLFI